MCASLRIHFEVLLLFPLSPLYYTSKVAFTYYSRTPFFVILASLLNKSSIVSLMYTSFNAIWYYHVSYYSRLLHSPSHMLLCLHFFHSPATIKATFTTAHIQTDTTNRTGDWTSSHVIMCHLTHLSPSPSSLAPPVNSAFESALATTHSTALNAAQ